MEGRRVGGGHGTGRVVAASEFHVSLEKGSEGNPSNGVAGCSTSKPRDPCFGPSSPRVCRPTTPYSFTPRDEPVKFPKCNFVHKLGGTATVLLFQVIDEVQPHLTHSLNLSKEGWMQRDNIKYLYDTDTKESLGLIWKAPVDNR